MQTELPAAEWLEQYLSPPKPAPHYLLNEAAWDKLVQQDTFLYESLEQVTTFLSQPRSYYPEEVFYRLAQLTRQQQISPADALHLVYLHTNHHLGDPALNAASQCIAMLVHLDATLSLDPLIAQCQPPRSEWENIANPAHHVLLHVWRYHPTRILPRLLDVYLLSPNVIDVDDALEALAATDAPLEIYRRWWKLYRMLYGNRFLHESDGVEGAIQALVDHPDPKTVDFLIRQFGDIKLMIPTVDILEVIRRRGKPRHAAYLVTQIEHADELLASFHLIPAAAALVRRYPKSEAIHKLVKAMQAKPWKKYYGIDQHDIDVLEIIVYEVNPIEENEQIDRKRQETLHEE